MAKTNYKLKVKLPNGTIQSADIYDSKEDMNAYKGKKRYINVKCPNGKKGYVQACLYAEGHRDYTKAWVKFPDGVQGALGNPMPNVPTGSKSVRGDKKDVFVVPKGIKVIRVMDIEDYANYVGVTPGKKYVFNHTYFYGGWDAEYSLDISLVGENKSVNIVFESEDSIDPGVSGDEIHDVEIFYSPEINKHKVDVTCY